MANVAKAHAGISLRQLLPQGQFVGSTDMMVRSCCGRWSEIEPDDLYVAIVDDESDGHDHVSQALNRGACGVVSERLVAVKSPVCIVEDSRQAYGRICHALAGNPTQQIQAIGITGSAGKTTTAHLIRSIFETAGGSAGLVSSLEPLNSLSSSRELRLSAPALANAFAAMFMHGHRHAVVEAPGAELAQHSLAGTELDVAVVTNIRREHLEWHGNVQNYRTAKARLLDYLKPTGFAVINADDPASNSLLDRLECPTLTIGLRQPAEVTARILERTASDQTFLLQAGNQSAPIQTKLLGQHQIYNCLSAAAVALVLGLELPEIAEGIQRIQSIAGRLEPVVCGQDFGVFIDISNTPSQLATALHTLKQVRKGKLICVATHHAQQTREQRARIGSIVERWADRSILTSDRVDQNLSYEPIHQMLDGFDKVHSAHVSPDRIQAIEFALSTAKPGDTVLISGCGDLPVASVDQRNWQVSDRDICQAWLYDQNNDPSNDPERIFRIDDYRN